MHVLAEPDTFMAITMDGKSPPRCPHFACLPKSLFTKHRPKFEIYGIINYGFSRYDYITYFDWWEHDANLGILLSFLLLL